VYRLAWGREVRMNCFLEWEPGVGPNGPGFLVFDMFRGTRFPLQRLEPIMPGVRSVSIAR
jgi:hypothetical protein